MSETRGRWTIRAAGIVALCFLINMVDGMDVNILSFIRAALSRDWKVADDAMGYVLSAGTLGMGFGALLIAPFADRHGRKPVIMTALALMSLGMLASGYATSIETLMLARLCVGMGIGTVLAAMAALAAEVAPPGWQDLSVAFVQAGFPLAAVGTGFVVAWAEPLVGWQALLRWAAYLTVALLPLAWLVLPARMASTTQATLSARAAVAALFGDRLRARTLLLWLAIFTGLLVLYSMLSWITKLASGAGLSDADSIYAGAFYNFGAFVGTISMGLLTLKFRPGVLAPALMTCAAVALLVFGNASLSVGGALFMAFVIGLTLQGGYNGMWPLAAGAYDAGNRATGIGWAMGIGRGGAVVGPIMAGYLLAAKISLPTILAIYCAPLLLCALCALLVGRHTKADPPAA
ncbi:MFS transporter [Novosphingobium sp. B 225]|uniref:MFS transporter n=1 Tax=Novosphingobium sp. B 225 TaxID=1961849 RepID=UPI0020CBC55B|nr:MFS transporter [Novosphingobium sp. B 225]